MVIEKRFMEEAIKEAREALSAGEVPVGAVVVKDGAIISRARNRVEETGDPSRHAELDAMKLASAALGTRYLSDCALYVTLEPCPMCAGACVNFRIGAAVFGAFDKNAGAMGSVTDLGSGLFGREIPAFGGIMEKECTELLSACFKGLR
ncbi:MAG: nucleoside deaminase [Clostridiales bacterium]|nr:nucleoside deaminase [Clostridiales bacterium]